MSDISGHRPALQMELSNAQKSPRHWIPRGVRTRRPWSTGGELRRRVGGDSRLRLGDLNGSHLRVVALQRQAVFQPQARASPPQEARQQAPAPWLQASAPWLQARAPQLKAPAPWLQARAPQLKAPAPQLQTRAPQLAQAPDLHAPANRRDVRADRCHTARCRPGQRARKKQGATLHWPSQGGTVVSPPSREKASPGTVAAVQEPVSPSSRRGAWSRAICRGIV